MDNIKLKRAIREQQTKFIDSQLIVETLGEAAESERLRTPILIHENYEQVPQRFVNCLTPETYIRPHKHTNLKHWEIKSWLVGELYLILFEEDGKIAQKYLLAPHATYVVEIPPNCYHTLVAITPAAYLEIRNCEYLPEADRTYAEWAPLPSESKASDYLQSLKNFATGNMDIEEESDVR